MAEKEEAKSIHIVDDKGGTMMEMQSMERDGDMIAIEGRLMGAWLSRMYMSPENTWRMICMVMKSGSVIGYMFSLPYLLLKRKKGLKQK